MLGGFLLCGTCGFVPGKPVEVVTEVLLRGEEMLLFVGLAAGMAGICLG